MDYLRPLDIMFVRNENYASGQMFDSVKLGISRAAELCGRILITPADVPLIEQDAFKQVMECPGARAAAAVRAIRSGRIHGWCRISAPTGAGEGSREPWSAWGCRLRNWRWRIREFIWMRIRLRII